MTVTKATTNIRLTDLVARFGGQLIGEPDAEVSGIAPLDSADSSHLTFLSNPKLRPKVAATAAAAVILRQADSDAIGDAYQGARIICGNPYAYFARVAQYFAAQREIPAQPGIHSSAAVDPSARIAASASIGPHVTIEADAVIEENCIIGAGSFIGRGARVGANTRLHPNVIFYAGCEIGQSGIVHSGAVIGADGFGFANEGGTWVKIPQTGRVVIGNDVEIGANTTIDRGALDNTVIEDGVKLDNQIQIAHNCRIGAHTAMAACVGIAGSANIGKYCTIGGAAMIAGHLTIPDRTHVSAGTFVPSSIKEPGEYTGIYPVAKKHEWEKSAVMVRNLTSMREKIRELEKNLKLLSQQNNEQP